MFIKHMVVSTDCWHYRYNQWLRRWWNIEGEPQTTHGCIYWQPMIWGSVITALLSPLIIFYQIFTGMSKLGIILFDRTLGNGVSYDYYNASIDEAPLPKREFNWLDRVVNRMLDGLEEMSASRGGQKAFLGFGFVLLSMVLSVFGYACSFGVHGIIHTVIPAVANYLPHFPGDAANLSLFLGDKVFDAHAESGYLMNIGWHASGHGLHALGGMIATEWSSFEVGTVKFFTNKNMWFRAARGAGWTAVAAAVMSIASYIVYEVSTHPAMIAYVSARNQRIEALRARNKLVRKELEAARRQKRYDAEMARERAKAEFETLKEKKKKERLKRGPSMIVRAWDSFMNNVVGYQVQVGPVSYKVLGGFQFFYSSIINWAKGQCPTIEFVSPQEIEQRKLAAEAKRKAEIEEADRRELENLRKLMALQKANYEEHLKETAEKQVAESHSPIIWENTGVPTNPCLTSTASITNANASVGIVAPRGNTFPAPAIDAVFDPILMVSGNVVKPIFPKGTAGCSFCGETKLSQVDCTFDCGFSGMWEPDGRIRITSICTKLPEKYKPWVPHISDLAPDCGPSCPSCGSSMVKHGDRKGQDFWGCSMFPKCRSTFSISKDERGPHELMQDRIQSMERSSTLDLVFTNDFIDSLQQTPRWITQHWNAMLAVKSCREEVQERGRWKGDYIKQKEWDKANADLQHWIMCEASLRRKITEVRDKLKTFDPTLSFFSSLINHPHEPATLEHIKATRNLNLARQVLDWTGDGNPKTYKANTFDGLPF